MWFTITEKGATFNDNARGWRLAAEAIKYASGGNLARCIALSSVENNCGICNEPYCQEQAGSIWHEIFGWSFCHMKCWKTCCSNYHRYLNHENKENTTLNFIDFVVNFNHAMMNFD